MTKKKVRCNLTYHFKGKLLLLVIFSLGCRDTCHFAKAQPRLQGLMMREVCGIPNLVRLTQITLLVIFH